MGTVTSMLWPTNGTGDGTATGYTDAQTQRLFRLLANAGRTATAGVVYGELNNLAVTYTSPSTLSVATGAAVVYGIPVFHDTSATTLALTAVAATTGGVVYLAVNWATQTGAINFRQSTSGDTAIPALMQTAGTLWEIPLAEYQVTSGGVATVTDARGWVNLQKLQIAIFPNGGENVTDVVPLVPDSRGLIMPNNKQARSSGGLYVPDNVIDSLPQALWANVRSGATTGNIVSKLILSAGAEGGGASSTTFINDVAEALGDTVVERVAYTDATGSLVAGEIAQVLYQRTGTSGSDTFEADIYLWGLTAEVWAWLK